MENVKQLVDSIINEMTLEEKVAQINQISVGALKKEQIEALLNDGTIGSLLFVNGDETEKFNNAAKSSRLGILPIYGIDAIHGHSCLMGATIFPSQLAMACSFDEELIEKMGEITAREVAADGQHLVFSPVLCIGRDPRWGRVDETFGEDTTLVSRLGAAIVRGYQKDGLVGACVKHYLAYGEATGGRDAYDSELTERKVRELFLPPFKAAVDAGCLSIMTAYGSIDSSPLTTSKKWLTNVLKDELGFDGFVLTDWGNIGALTYGQQVAKDMEDAAAMGIGAGNDMCMHVLEFHDAMISAVKNGKIAIERIDDAVRRVLTVKARLGLLGGERKIPSRDVIGCAEHMDLNYKLTLESNVLLKNNGILPISRVKKIAVIGPNADSVAAQYGDWTYLTHPNPDTAIKTLKEDTVSVLQGIKEIFDGEVTYSCGAGVFESEKDDDLITKAIESTKDADLVIAVIGDSVALNGETKDRAHFDIPGRQLEMIRKVKALGKRIVAVLINGKPLVLGDLIDNADAIIESFNGGDLSGRAIASLLFGKENFSGKLPISIPYSTSCMPCYYNQYTYWHHSQRYVDLPKTYSFPFGFGLNYSPISYSNIQISATRVATDGEFTVSVDIENEGELDAVEVVQLYFKDLVAKILTPCRTLIDFKRVPIKASEKKTVSFTVKASALGYYDADCTWCVDPGEIKLFITGNNVDLNETVITLE